MRCARPGIPAIALFLGVVAGCSSAGPAAEATAAPAPVAALPTPVAGASDSTDSPAPTFSATQAARGRQVFLNVCVECHTTSEFRGRGFLFSWRRRTAWSFYRNISANMPEDAPGSLSAQQYVDVIAYVLSLNGHKPADGELQATQAVLDRVLMDPGSP